MKIEMIPRSGLENALVKDKAADWGGMCKEEVYLSGAVLILNEAVYRELKNKAEEYIGRLKSIS